MLRDEQYTALIIHEQKSIVLFGNLYHVPYLDRQELRRRADKADDRSRHSFIGAGDTIIRMAMGLDRRLFHLLCSSFGC